MCREIRFRLGFVSRLAHSLSLSESYVLSLTPLMPVPEQSSAIARVPHMPFFFAPPQKVNGKEYVVFVSSNRHFCD
jgi:hypothetical protein